MSEKVPVDPSWRLVLGLLVFLGMFWFWESCFDRLEILKICAQNKTLAEDVDLARLARGTPGFAGAELENLLKEGALLAPRRKQEEITREDVEEARDKILLGLKRRGLALDKEEHRQDLDELADILLEEGEIPGERVFEVLGMEPMAV